MAFFKKRMSDKEFKMILENEALEKKHAKENMDDFVIKLDNTDEVKKAPMVITPEELLGIEEIHNTSKTNTETEDIKMENRDINTSDFLFNKMLEAREEATKKATEKPIVQEKDNNKGILAKKCESYIENAKETEETYDYFKLGNVDDILNEMEQKATEKVNQMFGIENTNKAQEIIDIIDDIKNPQPKEIKAEPEEIKMVSSDIFSYMPIAEDNFKDDDKNLPNSSLSEDIIEKDDNDDEFIDAEDIIGKIEENEKLDAEFEENFKSNIFNTIEIEEPIIEEEIEEEESIVEGEYQSINDKARIFKTLCKAKRNSLLKTILFALTLIFSIISEILLESETFSLIALSLLGISVILNFKNLKAIIELFKGNIQSELPVSIASIFSFIYNIFAILVFKGNIPSLLLASCIPLFINEIGRLTNASTNLKNFKILANEQTKKAVVFADEKELKKDASVLTGYDEANISVFKSTKNAIGFIKHSFSKDSGFKTVGIVSLIGLVFSIIAAAVTYVVSDFSPFTVLMAGILLSSSPVGIYISTLPLSLATSRLKCYDAALFGNTSVDALDNINNVVVDIADIFPEGTVKLIDFKLLSANPIDLTLIDAAALTHYANSPLAGIFKQITDNTDSKIPPVDTVVYEDRMGISGWVNDKRVFVGNRTLMEAHGYKVPSLDIDKKILQRGYFPVYVAQEDLLCALLIVKYTAHPEIAYELKRLTSTGVSVIVNNCDQNVTAEMITDYLGLYEDSVFIATRSMTKKFESLAKFEENVSTVALGGKTVCGLISIVTSAIKVKKLSKIMKILYVLLTICFNAALLVSVIYGNFAAISTNGISAAILASFLINCLPPYFTRP